ncbi:hypothetical protein ACFLU6_16360, partial [Acidobacteriota bacterium]
DLIFLGTVEKQTSRYNAQQTMIYTDVVFTDTQVVHAGHRSARKNRRSVTVSYAGGCMEHECVDVSGSPVFRHSGRYLVFMRDDGRPYLNPLVGGNQGLFPVAQDSMTGQAFVLTASGHAVFEDEAYGIKSSRHRVTSIHGGHAGYARSDLLLRELYFAEAPVPAGPTDTVTLHHPLAERDPIQQEPLTLKAFVGSVREILQSSGATSGSGLDAQDAQGAGGQPAGQAGESLDLTGPAPSIGTYAPMEGSDLGSCGFHDLPFVMEKERASSWSYDTTGKSMVSWNRYMQVYRQIDTNGAGVGNLENEIVGFLSDADAFNYYGSHWDDALAKTFNWYLRGTQCDKIYESDIVFNGDESWTDNENSALGDAGTTLYRPICMHELGHTWGYQWGSDAEGWGYPETYYYDVLTVMHAYWYNIVEDGRGIHAADAYIFRQAYGGQTAVKDFTDVGVEAYYANGNLLNATTSKQSLQPGESITIRNVTVENMSAKSVSNLRIRFFLSPDRNINTNDRQMGDYWFWQSFDAEAFAVGNYTTNIPDNAPEGTFYVGAIVTINGFGNDDYTPNNDTSLFTSITIAVPSTGDGGGGGGGCGSVLPVGGPTDYMGPWIIPVLLLFIWRLVQRPRSRATILH